MAEKSTRRNHERSTGELGDLVQHGYRFALALTHSVQQAEELVQDAWFSVLRARGPWSRRYLFSAIRSRFVDDCRRRHIVVFEPLAEDGPHGRDDGDAPPDETLSAGNGALHTALGTLRPEERTVLFLAAVEDYTAQQIAELLAWPRGTVLSMLHRTRRKLRESLQDRNGSLS